MFELPIYVTTAQGKYPIRDKGSYKMVLDCFNALNDEQLSERNRVITTLIIFYDNVSDVSDLLDLFGQDLTEPVMKMYEFFNCGTVNILGTKMNYTLLDWKKDEQLIAAAVNTVAGKEIRNESYIHWWTFMGYYQSIGECTLSTVLSIRNKIKKGKKLEKYEQEFKRDNPDYFVWNSATVAEKEATDLALSIWNSGG